MTRFLPREQRATANSCSTDDCRIEFGRVTGKEEIVKSKIKEAPALTETGIISKHQSTIS